MLADALNLPRFIHRRDGVVTPTVVGRRVWIFVLAVVAAGIIAVGFAVASLPQSPTNGWFFGLAALTIASGRFKIKIPGYSATVSVSEVFVFTSILLFGPGPATLVVVIDGLWISLTQKHRRAHRAAFNMAEPALSTWMAGIIFFAVADIPPLALRHEMVTGLLPAGVAMAAGYFLINSTLTALAIGLETGGSAFALWKRHALYLGINYYAAASVAILAVRNTSGINMDVVGLVLPLLVLSYVAYKTAASRVADAELHLSDVERLYQATVQTLAIAVDAKDQVTHGHICRVQRHTLVVAKAMGITDATALKALEAASLLHDVGKLSVPDYVLNKPGKLTAAEYDSIKLHANMGATILSAVDFPFPVVPIVRHHHEQWNGKGYPDGLAGTSIPLGARILGVVDCFDALTSDRPYRRAMTDADAITIIRERSESMYDGEVVEAFIRLVPELRRVDATTDGPLVVRAAAVDGHGSAAACTHEAEAPTEAHRLLSDVAPSLFNKLAQLMPDATACVFALDATQTSLRAVHASGPVRDVILPLRLKVGEGLAGWVAANRHTIANSDPALDLGDAAPRLGLASCTTTPVFALGDLVGILSVYRSEERAFTPRDIRLVGALAQEMGIAFATCEEAYRFDICDTYRSSQPAVTPA